MTNTLKFNDTEIHFTLSDGVWLIAIKPICEALDVDYTSAFKAIKSDPLLSSTVGQRPMVAADGKTRKMVCLPEFYIYGWLFSLRSHNEQLKKFQWECYGLLHDHFQGSITQRQRILQDKSIIQSKIDNAKNRLADNDDYILIQELEKQQRASSNSLRNLDKDLMTKQFSLFTAKS